VMRSANGDETIRLVVSTLRAKFDVVDVQENTVATSGDHAATAVASQDLATNTRRNALPGAPRGLTHVGGRSLDGPDVLRVAASHLHNL
jgi:hypothetical protein